MESFYSWVAFFLSLQPRRRNPFFSFLQSVAFRRGGFSDVFLPFSFWTFSGCGGPWYLELIN